MEFGMLIVGLVVTLSLGLIPAAIAESKGREHTRWWVYGFLFFFIALIHSLLINPNSEAKERGRLEGGTGRKCPFCAEVVKVEAIKCKHCGSILKATHT